MSRERDLLQTALGILEDYEWGYGGDHHKSPEASILNDIRKLLAQPEQEPVAWMLIDKETGARIPRAYKPEHGVNQDRWELYPLHTTLPKREPIAYVADASVGFDVSKSVQGKPLIWLGTLEYGDRLYRRGKDD